MNPFNSSAVAKAERMSVSAPSDGVEVVVDEAGFSGMLADVLVAASSDQAGGEQKNTPDNPENNTTGQPLQNPMVISMVLPELAPVNPPVSDAGLETMCSSVTLSDNTGVQSLTWMNGEETMKPAMPAETTPKAPETDAGESLSPAPSDTAEPSTPDVSPSAGPSGSTTTSTSREPGKWVITVPAEKTETASLAEKPEAAPPAANRLAEPVTSSADPKPFTVPIKTSESDEGFQVVMDTRAGSHVNVNVPAAGPEDNQAAPTNPSPVTRKKAKAVQRVDLGVQTSRPNSSRTPAGQAATADRGTEAGEDDTTSASLPGDEGEAGLLRRENVMARSEEMNSRTPEEQIPGTLRPGTNAHVLNVSKITGDSALSRMDGGMAPRVMPDHTLARVEQFQEFVSRLDHHILSASADHGKTMTVTLVPESLGKVVLNCREQGGHIWVEIQAANQSVREVLQRQEELIRQMMDQSGYKLMQFDVRSQTGEGNLRHFRRPSQENENAADGEGYVRPSGQGLESEPAIAASPMTSRRGLWVVA